MDLNGDKVDDWAKRKRVLNVLKVSWFVFMLSFFRVSLRLKHACGCSLYCWGDLTNVEGV